MRIRWRGSWRLPPSCEAALPAGRGIYLRSDFAAYQAGVINYYSQPDGSFSITADLDVAVNREMRNLPETAWQPYRIPGSGVIWPHAS